MVISKLLPVLICFPFIMAFIVFMIRKNDKLRRLLVFIGSGAVIAVCLIMSVSWFLSGAEPTELYVNTHIADKFILAGEILLMLLVTYKCFKYRRYAISLLSIVPTIMMIFLEFEGNHEEGTHILVDRLSVLMCLVVAIVGGLICIYAVGYMQGYHEHHKEFKEKKSMFFALLFVFLGAMFGLVLSSNLMWLDFFWEVTSVCSFLLIGYTETDEAITNSFRQLWMNLLGGCGFAFAVFYASMVEGTVSLQTVTTIKSVIPVAFLAFAALTKSAQLPFSGWLLGAMVAPTPTSALLHSATMVKGGVYMLLRLAPAMSGTLTGTMVAYIGGFTFLATSFLAISQSDAKKVLAYSTISNLGLITACAGVGTKEAVWVGVFLLIFHAVSKSMLFQTVGAVENSTGSRNIETMQGLVTRMPKLCFIMAVGIISMYVAPFGMLIGKWTALKSFIDSNNIVLIIFFAYGCATTTFYWTKWLCHIIAPSCTDNAGEIKDKTEFNEYFSLFAHLILMVALCGSISFISNIVASPIVNDLYGESVSLMSKDNIIITVILVAAIFVIPFVSYLISKNYKSRTVKSYMSGINVTNTSFVDSFGETVNLKNANWYMNDLFGEHKLKKGCEIITAVFLVIILAINISGGIF